jgi:cytochrome c-type biogenesis protein CcmH
MRARLVAPALLAALALTAPATAAGAGCRQTTLANLENQVMCVVCGVPLALAEAPQADRERAFIARLIGECRSEREIKAALVAQYGPSVLALPQAEGFRLAAYLVPALAAALVAAGLAFVALQRRRRRSPPGLVAASSVDPCDAARLDADLERYR